MCAYTDADVNLDVAGTSTAYIIKDPKVTVLQTIKDPKLQNAAISRVGDSLLSLYLEPFGIRCRPIRGIIC